MSDIKTSDCWQKAYQLIANGETMSAVALCEQEICSGLVECQRFLGRTYHEQNDMENALKWFSKAAEQGDPFALFGVGNVHFARKDFQTALAYYERSAEQGYPRAYNWVAHIYQHGLGVPQSAEMAIKYYRKAAAYGYLIAERALIHIAFQQGSMLDKILAVPKYIYILIKAAVLAYRNINDERIRDIPNAFQKKQLR